MRRGHAWYELAAVLLGMFATIMGGSVETVGGFLWFVGIMAAAVHFYLVGTTPKRPRPVNRHPRKHWNDL